MRCGRRAGKTYLALTTILKAAVDKPGEYWFISPTYRQSKEIAWKLLFKLLPQGAAKSINETELACHLINGSTIKLKGADNEDSLRGVGLNGVVLDEYAFMKANVWEEIVRPMLFDTGGWAMFISTPKGYNHFWELWEQATRDQWARFHFTTYDNPHIKPEEVEESRHTMSELRFGQEILAEFTKFEGAIWSNFTRDYHIIPRREPKSEATIYGSIDFGFAKGHPTAVLWHEVMSEEVHTFHGFTEEGLNIDKIDEYMRAQTNGLTVSGIFPDTARPDLIEELRMRGWPILETIKDVEVGISKVDEYMQINPLTGKPRWTIADHLVAATRQIENYEWMEVRGEDGKYKQVPRKENDDNCDALRYFLASYSVQQQPELVVVGTERGLGGVDIPVYDF